MGSTLKYDSQAVFASNPTASGNLTTGDIRQLSRVQSANFSIDIQREDVGGLSTAMVSENIVIAPTVNLDFGYLVTNGQNEKTIGFAVDGKHGGLFTLNSGERDYFIYSENQSEPVVIGIGNGLLSRYSVNGQVGDFLKASASVQGFNIRVDTGTSGNYLPRVDAMGNGSPYTYVLPPVTHDTKPRTEGGIEDNIFIAPGDMEINFPNDSALGILLSGEGKSHLQDFDISISMDRTEMNKIGSRYSFKRCLHLPLEVSLNARFYVSKFVADKIQNYLCQDSYDVDINIKSPKCTSLDIFWEETSDPQIKLRYGLRGLKLNNIDFGGSIDERVSVNVSWGVKVGNLLSLDKNFFISGDFGAYRFPVESFEDLGPQPVVTGQGLQSFERHIYSKRVKSDVEFGEFKMEMNSDLDIHSGDYPSFIYYQGDMSVEQISGKFGSGIQKADFFVNMDSFSTVYDKLPESGVSQRFYPLRGVPFYSGTPFQADPASGEYRFYFKGVGFNQEPIKLSFAGLPDSVVGAFETEEFTINSYEPYYFNKFYLGVRDTTTATGVPFSFDIVASTSKFKKVYKFDAYTDESYHYILPKYYADKTTLWLDPYVEPSISLGANNIILSFSDESLNNRQFTSFSGSGYRPDYVLNGLNGRPYIHMESGAGFVHSGGVLQDMRNFTFVSLGYTTAQSSGADYIRMYNSQNISGRKSNTFRFGQFFDSEDLSFSYTAVTGFSGLSGAPTFILPNGFANGEWTLSVMWYDGQTIRGRVNGATATPVNMTLSSGSYDTVSVGSGLYGNLAEMFLMPFAMDLNEISGLENYIRYKWGLGGYN